MVRESRLKFSEMTWLSVVHNVSFFKKQQSDLWNTDEISITQWTLTQEHCSQYPTPTLSRTTTGSTESASSTSGSGAFTTLVSLSRFFVSSFHLEDISSKHKVPSLPLFLQERVTGKLSPSIQKKSTTPIFLHNL